MANINSLMSSTASNTSSLYGTRNVLSGLASGMDTEAMIENSVSGYKGRITQLQQEQTKYQWKQDAYRGITDKMYDLTQKYTSFTSKTNLLSNSFFNNAISTTVNGPSELTSKVSASGRSSSDIQILAAQTASAASYSVAASNLGLNVSNTTTGSITAGAGDTELVGTLKGTMTINYNGNRIDLTFDETDGTDGTTIVDAIQAKLENATVNTSYGARKASELVNVDTDSNGNIVFSDGGNSGASPYVSYLDSSMKSALGATESSLYAGSSDKKYTFAADGTFYDDTKTVADYLSGKSISVTVDGVTKSFKLDKSIMETEGIQEALLQGINGLGLGGLTADVSTEDPYALSFSVGDTSTFSISVADERAAALLGLDAGISNYLDTKSTLGNLLDLSNFTKNSDGLYDLTINGKSVSVSADDSLESVLSKINNSDMGVNASYSKLTGKFVFTAKETGAGGSIDFQSDLAKSLFTTDPTQRTLKDALGLADNVGDFTLKIGSLTVGTFNANETIGDVMDFINTKDADGYAVGTTIKGSVGYDSETGAFSVSSAWRFRAYDENDDSLAISNSIAGNQFFESNTFSRTKGTDATVRALVNGELTTLTRASNTIDMDGMKVTLNGSFNTENLTATAVSDTERANAISFNTSAGSDDLMKTITDFVNDYNSVLKQLHDAYATQPAEKNSSTHARYDPLTDDDKSGMSEKAIENYEAKAKQGILFGDGDLRAAYEALVRAISPSGNDGAALRNMGIEATYSGGLTQIKLDETKLRDALAQDPDSVRNAFTKSKEYGASSDGLMTSIKEVMERYSSTSFASPGILVKKAGSTYSSTSLLNNTVQSQIDSVQKKIEQWQTKMSSKIDYYTRQFTALEKLMNTMNTQSSALAGLMGGY